MYARNRTRSMAPITSAVLALQRNVALAGRCHSGRRAVLTLRSRGPRAPPLSTVSGAAAASTLATKVEPNIDCRPVQDVVVVGAGIAGGQGFEYQADWCAGGRGRGAHTAHSVVTSDFVSALLFRLKLRRDRRLSSMIYPIPDENHSSCFAVCAECQGQTHPRLRCSLAVVFGRRPAFDQHVYE